MRRACALAVALGALAAAAPAGAAFDRPLPIPKVLSGSNLEIPIVESEVQIRPGAKTRMWTYGGTFPGPTIRRPAGSRTRVRFTNQLDRSAGEMTVHLHGGHVPSSEDGQPHEDPGAGPGGPLIESGETREYVWDHLEAGGPERAAFQWYHDHRMDVTGRNVWRGLAGMFILDDEVDRALPLPKGRYDIPLMVVDRRLDDNNQLTYPDPLRRPGFDGLLPGTGVPPADEVTGDLTLVNGALEPHLEVEDRRYRFRLLNASNFRTFEFSLEGQLPMTQIATESGLLPRPVERANIPLGPAERAEVVIDFAGFHGQELDLRTADGNILRFRVTKRADGDPSSVPGQLRPLPELGKVVKERSFTFGLGLDTERGRQAWTINGRPFSHQRVEAAPEVGTTEVWRLTNAASNGVPHYIHIHAVDWVVLSRNGEPPAPWEAIKETLVIEEGETVVVAARFTDHLGKFVFHCHMLEHEDNGMMANFAVGGDAGPPPQGAEDPAFDVRVGGPDRVRPGRVARFRVGVRNDAAEAAEGVRAELSLPRGFRARGPRADTLGTLAPGRRKTFTVAARAPENLRSSRLRLRALVTGRIGGRDVRARSEHVYGVRRSARAAAAGASFLCRPITR